LSFVFDLPLSVVGIALVVILCGLAALGLVVVRRRVIPRLHISDNDGHFTSTMVHSVMVFYALTVAMIAITVWETYDGAARIVSGEATALAALYRNVSAYPSPEQSKLQDELRSYTRYVIDEAWPEQHKGFVPLGGVERINRFQKILTGFEPATEGQKILHEETFRSYNHLVEARRMRLDAVQTALPALMWTVIFLGAGLAIVASYFFRVSHPRIHMYLVVLLTAFFAMVIFVVFAFDRPVRGDMGIKAEPYELAYEQLMKR
jgi:hypothetical protein